MESNKFDENTNENTAKENIMKDMRELNIIYCNIGDDSSFVNMINRLKNYEKILIIREDNGKFSDIIIKTAYEY